MKPKTTVMKLLLLIILLCGITSKPYHTAKAKKACAVAKRSAANLDMVPSGLLFQF